MSLFEFEATLGINPKGLDNRNVSINYALSEQEEYKRDTLIARFILLGTLLPLIVGLGLIGNTLNILVLRTKDMWSYTVLYLRALTVIDIGILLANTLIYTPAIYAERFSSESSYYFLNRVLPFLSIPTFYTVSVMRLCNIWITVFLPGERYVSIVYPSISARLITRPNILISIATILVISAVYNIPYLYASAPGEIKCPHKGFYHKNNVPSISYTCYSINATDYYNTQEFKLVYCIVMYSIVVIALPLLALLILNALLIKELFRMKKEHIDRHVTYNEHNENCDDDHESDLSMVLVSIITIFVICQIPSLVSQFDILSQKRIDLWLAIVTILVTTHSAVNFAIYFAFSQKFRKVLHRVSKHLYKQFINKGKPSVTTTSTDVDGFSHLHRISHQSTIVRGLRLPDSDLSVDEIY